MSGEGEQMYLPRLAAPPFMGERAGLSDASDDRASRSCGSKHLDPQPPTYRLLRNSLSTYQVL